MVHPLFLFSAGTTAALAQGPDQVQNPDMQQQHLTTTTTLSANTTYVDSDVTTTPTTLPLSIVPSDVMTTGSSIPTTLVADTNSPPTAAISTGRTHGSADDVDGTTAAAASSSSSSQSTISLPVTTGQASSAGLGACETIPIGATMVFCFITGVVMLV